MYFPLLENYWSILKFDEMRILIVMIVFFFCVIQVNGQKQKKTHLFGDKPKDLSIFINPTFQFTGISQQYCSIPGIRAGVIINKRLIIGGVYNYTFNNITLPEAKGGGQLRMQWGGLHLEYTMWPQQFVHLTIPVSAGMGQLKTTGATIETMTGDPNFLFAETGLMIEFNIWKHAKLGLGGIHRYTKNVAYNLLTSSDLSAFAFAASVKFGFFDYDKRR